jgi:putative acyl-CoA dehydrogenase
VPDSTVQQATNQVPPLADYDLTAADPALRAGLAAAGTTITPALADLATAAGSAAIIEQARLANVHPPVLHTHDRSGHRIDEVEFHPAWHMLMSRAVGAGLHGAPWAPDSGEHAHLHRAAGFYLWTQTESGHLCPISMTYAAVPVIRQHPALAAAYCPGLQSTHYDFGLRPARSKLGLLAGMSMTEKQGGSDVRANTTTATPIGGSGSAAGEYRLDGHKWFTSAPMNDVFLTLAQAPGGLTCFLLPRVLPDGRRNGLRLVRLKDKLGNRSNASAEIEYDDAIGWRIGDEGRGVATILQMVTMTRVDCVLGSAGQMRAALSEAAYYAAHRWAFGRPLADQPAMRAVLADLAVESWASTLTALRLGSLVDRTAGAAADSGNGAAQDAALLRLALPAAKFWVCKRAVPMIAEALECLGGNGYVESFPMARLLRESPLNGIWEGSGTVSALDAVRALDRSPACADALLAELGSAGGAHPAFDGAVTRVNSLLSADPDPASARTVASLIARLFAAGLLLQHAPAEVAAVYCATRLGDGGDRVFGDLPPGFRLADIVAAATPMT